MSLPELLTWLAIAVLVLGTPAIFVWFLRDLPALLGEDEGEDREGG